MILVIETYNADDDLLFSRKIDFRDKDHREWLTKHITWAVNQQYGVDIQPVGFFK